LIDLRQLAFGVLLIQFVNVFSIDQQIGLFLGVLAGGQAVLFFFLLDLSDFE
jgi:hypothetical protein